MKAGAITECSAQLHLGRIHVRCSPDRHRSTHHLQDARNQFLTNPGSSWSNFGNSIGCQHQCAMLWYISSSPGMRKGAPTARSACSRAPVSMHSMPSLRRGLAAAPGAQPTSAAHVRSKIRGYAVMLVRGHQCSAVLLLCRRALPASAMCRWGDGCKAAASVTHPWCCSRAGFQHHPVTCSVGGQPCQPRQPWHRRPQRRHLSQQLGRAACPGRNRVQQRHDARLACVADRMRA